MAYALHDDDDDDDDDDDLRRIYLYQVQVTLQLTVDFSVSESVLASTSLWVLRPYFASVGV
jgi:hypothetical protein